MFYFFGEIEHMFYYKLYTEFIQRSANMGLTARWRSCILISLKNEPSRESTMAAIIGQVENAAYGVREDREIAARDAYAAADNASKSQAYFTMKHEIKAARDAYAAAREAIATDAALSRWL